MFDKAVDILNADTDDLLELARLVEANPKTIFIGADFTGIDIGPKELDNYELYKSKFKRPVGKTSTVRRRLNEKLEEQQQVLGTYHPDTLRTRHQIAHWEAQNGNIQKAINLFKELAPDQEHLPIDVYPNELSSLLYIASLTAEKGEIKAAVLLYESCLQYIESLRMKSNYGLVESIKSRIESLKQVR